MTAIPPASGLSAAALTLDLAPEDLPFTTTEELEPLYGLLGQVRAQKAIAFGLAMARPGYNIFIMGEPGTGRLSFAARYLASRAREEPAASDWLYLNNFSEPREPVAIRVAPGQGKRLLADLETFIDNLLATFPAAFENPAYQRRRTAIDREFQNRYGQAVTLVERRAQEQGVALFRSEDGVSFSPMIDGKPADEDVFAALPEQDKETFHAQARILEDYLGELLAELPGWRRASFNQLRQLDQETIDRAIEPLLAELCEKYGNLPAVLHYLGELRRDLPRTVSEHLAEANHAAHEDAGKRAILAERYAARLLVAHPPEDGAPVVYEPNPDYPNLFGRIEYVNTQGTLLTHHRLIFPGALHRANGGYLILEAEKLFTDEPVWPAFKRALETRQIRIEPAAEDPAMAAMTLKPEVIPLSVKVILVGGREIYDALQEADGEFGELFRVLAEFEEDFPRTPAAMLDFARLVKTHAAADGAAPLTAAAVCRLIGHSARLAEHRERLSARLPEVFELVGEAELQRRRDGEPVIGAAQIRKALAAKDERLGRIRESLLEDMLADTILIDTEGDAIGRINALTVLDVGGHRFGTPARITATAYPGSRGVVDIEREVQLGQAIHSKGVLILSGYLGYRYARGFPLAISANLALEQSYGYVDGDSAALAEACALISALAGLPIAQSFAVTGSINQHGEVQAVGGVNEKVEGFFRLCRARELSGRQGVLIPKANVRNLVLADEVVEAVQRREFSIHAVDSVDRALELLTGTPAGRIARTTAAQLRAMAKRATAK